MTAHRRNAPAQASIKNDETLMSVPEQEVSRILPLSEITGKKIRPLRGTCKIVEPVGEVQNPVKKRSRAEFEASNVEVKEEQNTTINRGYKKMKANDDGWIK